MDKLQPTYSLREQQLTAFNQTREALRKCSSASPLIVSPTGTGKSYLIAHIGWGTIQRKKRAIAFAPTILLAIQNAKKLCELLNVRVDVVTGKERKSFSPGDFNIQTTKEASIVCATPGAWSNDVLKGKQKADFATCMIDEAHMTKLEDEGTYRNAISLMPDWCRVVGLTATPYREGEGYLTDGNLFTSISYKLDVIDAVEQGLLSPLKTPADLGMNLENVEISDREDVDEAVKVDLEAMRKTDRKKTMFFCSTIAQCKAVAKALSKHGEHRYVIAHSEMSKAHEQIEKFRRDPEIKAIVSANMLTTGFNVEAVDCLSMMRGVQSLPLLEQIEGRAMRLHDGKDFALYLDHGQNLARFGPVGDRVFEPPTYRIVGGVTEKRCPSCQAMLALSVQSCKFCGYEFTKILDESEVRTKVRAAIPSSESAMIDTKIRVNGKRTSVHSVANMMVDETKTRSGKDAVRVEFLNKNHDVIALETLLVRESWDIGRQARAWVKTFCDGVGDDDMPMDDLLVPRCVGYIRSEKFRRPTHIRTFRNGIYRNIVSLIFEDGDEIFTPVGLFHLEKDRSAPKQTSLL